MDPGADGLEPSLHRSFYRQRVKASGAALVDNTVEEPASSQTWTGGSEGGRSRQVEREERERIGKLDQIGQSSIQLQEMPIL